jgi:hypothetical protein
MDSDESFGAFDDDAPNVSFSGPKTSEETSDKQMNLEEESPSIQTASETPVITLDESFGDFDEAPKTSQTVCEESSFVPNFHQNPHIGEEEQSNSVPAIVDQDFGDFHDFESNRSKEDVTLDIHDSQPLPGDNLGSTQEDDDDDDDDFGDFADFHTHSDIQPGGDSNPTVNDKEDDFEEFGDFSQTVETNYSVPLMINDPLIDRAKAVFSRIPTKVIEDIQLENVNSDPEEIPPSLTELLVRTLKSRLIYAVTAAAVVAVIAAFCY